MISSSIRVGSMLPHPYQPGHPHELTEPLTCGNVIDSGHAAGLPSGRNAPGGDPVAGIWR